MWTFGKFIENKTCTIFSGLNDIGPLASDLKPVFVDWFELGLTLGFSSSQLKEIEATNKKLSRCMIDMLEAWIKKGGDKTRLQVLQALRDPLVDHSNIADGLERKYTSPA